MKINENFPSEDVDKKAFEECLSSYKNNLCFVGSTEMEKNELAVKISVDYYGEGYTKKALDLAEHVYYSSSGGFQTAKIIKGSTPAKPSVNKKLPPNPYSRYKI